MNHSPAVLRNKGVCVSLNETALGENGVWNVVRDDEGTPTTVKTWIRFDGNSLADLEEAFGNLDAYQKATAANPNITLRRTLAITLGWDDLHPRLADGRLDPSGKLCPGCRRAGLAMREGGLNEYSTAVGAALALANGLDPTHVVKLIEQGVKATTEAEAKRDAALEEMLAADAADQEAESTSTDGSADGSELAEATTSSGG